MSTTTDMTVRRTITVDAEPGRAFEAFTAHIDRWWPRQGYSIGTAPLREVVLERRAGGRWYERDDDGSECAWGRVLTWTPPGRLVLAWQISADWAFAPELVTEIDVRFTAEPGGRTRVDLEHRYLDRYGDRAAEMIQAFASPDGWPGLLGSFAAAATPVSFDQHTLVMLTLRPDAPDLTAEQAAALQDAHMAYTADLVAAGHILAAGPPLGQDDERLRGISIWSADPGTVRQLLAADPAVQAGRLAGQVCTWMVPAGQVRFEKVAVPRSMSEAGGS